MTRPIKEVEKDFIPVRITTSIPMMCFLKCKRERWGWSRVFNTGYAILVNGGDFPTRIKELEAMVEALRRKVETRDKMLESSNQSRKERFFRPPLNMG